MTILVWVVALIGTANVVLVAALWIRFRSEQRLAQERSPSGRLDGQRASSVTRSMKRRAGSVRSAPPR
jgi:hypothetical protein